jgi:hypothetical protein
VQNAGVGHDEHMPIAEGPNLVDEVANSSDDVLEPLATFGLIERRCGVRLRSEVRPLVGDLLPRETFPSTKVKLAQTNIGDDADSMRFRNSVRGFKRTNEIA